MKKKKKKKKKKPKKKKKGLLAAISSQQLMIMNRLICRWGRRKSYLLLIYMAVTLAIVTSFSPNYTFYMIIRTINGLTFPALNQIPYILGVDLIT